MFFKSLKFIEREFVPVLLAVNLNSYCLAREFYEAYGVKSIVLGKFSTVQIIDSKLLDFRKIENFDNNSTALEEINKIANESKSKKIILLGCSDTQLKFIIQNKLNLRENIITPYIEMELAEKLMNKDTFSSFARKYNLAMPKESILTHSEYGGMSKKASEMQNINNDKYNLEFNFPIVVKPANQPLFFSYKFIGQKKVYIIESQSELDSEIAKIYKSGYKESLILQEYIPGDDSSMYVMNCYSDRNAKVTMMSFANILLEEHTPTARGNHAVIINSYDEKLFKLVKNFLEDIKFVGFSNFDIKYDKRDDTFKFFEMNIRQGNSHYHVTAAGVNVVEFLVDDRIYGKDRELTLVKSKRLFSIVPNILALWYVKDMTKRKEMLSLIAKGKSINPLYNFKDMTFKRLFYLELNYFGHFIKFFKYFKRLK